jgi:hypothetical protein
MSRQTKGGMEAARLTQVNVRLPEVTRRQIANLRAALGLSSDAQVVIMAVDRMAQQELRED